VLAVPKMGHLFESGALSKCILVLVAHFFQPSIRKKKKKKLGVFKLLGVPKMGQMT